MSRQPLISSDLTTVCELGSANIVIKPIIADKGTEIQSG